MSIYDPLLSTSGCLGLCSDFWFLWENTMNVHICLCGDNFTVLLDTYLGVDLLGHTVKKVLVAQVVSDSLRPHGL